MIRQQCGLRLDDVREALLEHPCNAMVVLLPRALQQRLTRLGVERRRIAGAGQTPEQVDIV